MFAVMQSFLSAFLHVSYAHTACDMMSQAATISLLLLPSCAVGLCHRLLKKTTQVYCISCYCCWWGVGREVSTCLSTIDPCLSTNGSFSTVMVSPSLVFASFHFSKLRTREFLPSFIIVPRTGRSILADLPLCYYCLCMISLDWAAWGVCCGSVGFKHFQW